MGENLSLSKIEDAGRSEELLVVAGASSDQKPLDQNPAAVYLATLRPSGQRSMTRALTKVAEVASSGRHTAFTLPWHLLRYQHTAAIASILQEQYRPATVNQMLSGLRSVLTHAENLGLMSAEDYRRAVKIKSVKAETLPRGRALKPGEMIALIPGPGGL
jgi:hypothetical protein